MQQALKIHLHNKSLDIIFKAIPTNHEQAYQDLENEKVDLLLHFILPAQNSLTSQVISTDEIYGLVRQDHPRITDPISEEEYYAEEHILLNLRLFDLPLDDYFIINRLNSRKIYCEHSSEISMLSTVADTDAIAIMPKRVIDHFQHLFKIRKVSLPFKTRPVEYHMIWPKKLSQSPAHQWLRSTIENITNNIESSA